MKKGIVLIILCLLAGLGWLALTPPRYPIEEGKNIFETNIYRRYREQMKSFFQESPYYFGSKFSSKTKFNLKMKKLIQEIERPVSSPQEQRASHEAFVNQLRELASSFFLQKASEEELSSKMFFESMIRWIFLSADLTPDMQSFLFHHIAPPQDNLFPYLRRAQKVFQSNPKFNGTEREADYEDPFLHGNLPSNVAWLNNDSRTQVIRLGKPIYQFSRSFWWWTSPEVCPEFLLFLQLQPSHLYVNLMKRRGIEWKSTKCLESLERKVQNLFVITLDKDSSFYWQREKGSSEIMESERFKKEFLDNMMSHKGNFFWSKHLNPSAWRRELHGILDHVHHHHFAHEPVLNRRERQDFIELCYLAILDVLVDKWSPASMNITCRQGMDRGPSLMVLWLMQKSLLDKDEVAALILAPPLVTRNRSSHAPRIERFISAGARLGLEAARADN